jgi:hypothetical protein
MAKCCMRLPRKSGRSNRPKTDPSVLQLLAKPHILGRNMTNWHLNVILDVQYNSMTTEERALVSVWLLGDLARQNDQWSVQAKIDHRQCIFSIPYPLSKYPFTLAVEPSTQTTSIWSVNFSRAKQARNARSTALSNAVSVIEQSSASLNSSCRSSSTVRMGQWARSMCHSVSGRRAGAVPDGVHGLSVSVIKTQNCPYRRTHLIIVPLAVEEFFIC